MLKDPLADLSDDSSDEGSASGSEEKKSGSGTPRGPQPLRAAPAHLLKQTVDFADLQGQGYVSEKLEDSKLYESVRGPNAEERAAAKRLEDEAKEREAALASVVYVCFVLLLSKTF